MHKSGAEESELLHTKKVATKLHQGGTSSSSVTHQDDALEKAAARTEIFEAPGPGAKRIDRVHLKTPPLRSHLNTKGGTIPGGMHGTGGPSGKTLSLPELVELLGPTILGALNATEKMGTLIV